LKNKKETYKMKKVLLLLILALFVGLAACSNDTPPDVYEPAEATEPATEPTPEPQAPEEPEPSPEPEVPSPNQKKNQNPNQNQPHRAAIFTAQYTG